MVFDGGGIQFYTFTDFLLFLLIMDIVMLKCLSDQTGKFVCVNFYFCLFFATCVFKLCSEYTHLGLYVCFD